MPKTLEAVKFGRLGGTFVLPNIFKHLLGYAFDFRLLERRIYFLLSHAGINATILQLEALSKFQK